MKVVEISDEALVLLAFSVLVFLSEVILVLVVNELPEACALAVAVAAIWGAACVAAEYQGKQEPGLLLLASRGAERWQSQCRPKASCGEQPEQQVRHMVFLRIPGCLFLDLNNITAVLEPVLVSSGRARAKAASALVLEQAQAKAEFLV